MGQNSEAAFHLNLNERRRNVVETSSKRRRRTKRKKRLVEAGDLLTTVLIRIISDSVRATLMERKKKEWN